MSDKAMPERERILLQAIRHTTQERNVEYGAPYHNLGDCADLWSTYLNCKYMGASQIKLTAEDAAHFNVLQKMARTFNGKPKADTYEDMAAYSAIAGECAMLESEQ